MYCMHCGRSCSCFVENVPIARVIYSNLDGTHMQQVFGIVHDVKNNLYVGHTQDKRTWSHSLVFARYNHGPYYEHWAWDDYLQKEKSHGRENLHS